MGFDVYGKSGNYFRACCWSWRPIHALCEEVNTENNLGLSFELWGSNDGAGLDNQHDCNKLADALEEHAKERERYVLELDSDIRVDRDGLFLPKGQPGKSPWETDREHVLEFVKFLRECGGSFEIC
jgi:hypothetical protein